MFTSYNNFQLKGKHCRKPHCRNGVVDTFEHCLQQKWAEGSALKMALLQLCSSIPLTYTANTYSGKTVEVQ